MLHNCNNSKYLRCYLWINDLTSNRIFIINTLLSSDIGTLSSNTTHICFSPGKKHASHQLWYDTVEYVQINWSFDYFWILLYSLRLFFTKIQYIQNHLLHTTYTVRNKWEKLEHKGEAIFDIPFMIQSHAESMKKILGAL